MIMHYIYSRTHVFNTCIHIHIRSLSCRLSCVNKYLQHIASSQLLWKEYFIKIWPAALSSTSLASAPASSSSSLTSQPTSSSSLPSPPLRRRILQCQLYHKNRLRALKLQQRHKEAAERDRLIFSQKEEKTTQGEGEKGKERDQCCDVEDEEDTALAASAPMPALVSVSSPRQSSLSCSSSPPPPPPREEAALIDIPHYCQHDWYTLYRKRMQAYRGGCVYLCTHCGCGRGFKRKRNLKVRTYFRAFLSIS